VAVPPVPGGWIILRTAPAPSGHLNSAWSYWRGLRSEASNRWEKGVDPHIAGAAATLATQLIVELAGARWTGAADVQGTLPERALIRLRPERTDTVLGLAVPADEQAAILAGIGFDPGPNGFLVPTWRARDITREIDLIEEVSRFKMSEIPFTLPRRDAMFGRLTRWQRLRRVVEDVLAGCGFYETYTPTFVADVAGTYVITLTVSNGIASSTSSVTVTAQ